MNYQKSYEHGVLHVSAKNRLRVMLTFIRTENVGNGYGISKEFEREDISPEVEDLFVDAASRIF